MRIFHVTLKLLTFAVLTVVLTAQAQAQATRTWVSGVGDDVNPCSRTAPCKTFAGAISKTAINGEIDVIDPGAFGAVTIVKSITIDGGGMFAGILAGGINGVVINIAPGNANDPNRSVRLRRIAITGTGSSGTVGTRTGIDGVRILKAASVFIDDVVIQDFTEEGVEINGDAEVNLFMDDVQIRNCNVTGVKVQTTAGFIFASLNNVRIQACTTGLDAANRSRVGVNASNFTKNPTGMKTTGNNSIINLEQTFVSMSTVVGLIASAGSTIRVSSCTITQNVAGINANGGFMVSLENNSVFGNTTDGTFTSTEQKL